MALATVIITAIVCAIAALSALMLANNHAQVAHFDQRRIQARQAAEGGLVWAMQRLWENPSFCGGVGCVCSPTPPTINGMTVTLSAQNCGTESMTVNASVTY